MKKNFGFIAVIFATIIFGCLPLLAKIIYGNGGNAVSVIFYRFFLPLPILYFLSKRTGDRDIRINKKELKDLILVSIFGYGITAVLMFSSYTYISTGVATTLHFTYPIFVVLGDIFIFKDKPSFIKIFCILLCSMGVMLFLQDIEVDNILGIVIAILSGVTYAFYMLYIEKSSLKTMNPFKLTFYLGLVSSIYVFIIAIVTKQFVFNLTLTGWGVTILLSILTSVIGFTLFNYGIQSIGSQNASIFSTFEPITSVVIGILIFNEKLSLQIVVGGIFILASVLITAISEKKKKLRENI